MAAELEALLQRPLTWQISPFELLVSVQKWIKETRPTCLLHPHGFYVLLLKRTPTEEWRLHLWPRGERKLTGMPARIHTHDRHVESRILKGSLTNIDYDAREVAEGGCPLYLVSYQGDRYARATTNALQKSATRIQVDETSRLELHAGDYYRIERHTLHEALIPVDQNTITLVCMHGQEEGAVKVVGIEGYPGEIAFERNERSAEVFLAYI
ncbi:hypothetical protein [Pseudomonas sp.]|uniref:hypothetical protein n=1 Tax=Pseudomonas sp. TaxID=306 RepID=UPI002489E8BD|nr:hypothetical protein [Pseudomonas sp.]MDI1330877.1 hypothetical protein [Pseudomonas sp.]